MKSNEALHFFAKYIASELGIIYAEHNYFQLQNRLDEIAKMMGVSSIENLYEMAKKEISPKFRVLLLDLATNNETSFFRDPKAFAAIESAVLKPFKEGKLGLGPLRIWSAASSSGQEALSLTILIKEFMAKNGVHFDFSILATDISERILERAKSATYSQLEIQRGLTPEQAKKYFTKDHLDRWVANPDIRKHTEFKKLNLKEPFLFDQKFHLVLCRNVLIYQNVDAKKEILTRISATLAAGQFMVLGSGESMLGLSNDFLQMSVDGAIIYQKKEKLSQVS